MKGDHGTDDALMFCLRRTQIRIFASINRYFFKLLSKEVTTIRATSDVFERRTSSGSGLFAFLEGGFCLKSWANRLYKHNDT